jgi:hypothetical protein
MGVLTVIDSVHGVPLEAVLAIDDRDDELEHSDHVRSWLRWLQIANAFIGQDHSWSLATVKQGRIQRPASGTSADALRTEMLRGASREWEILHSSLDEPLARTLAAQLAAAGIGAPVYGAEVADGIPVDFLWEDPRVAVLLEPDEESVADLVKDGWTVVEPVAELIVAALSAGERER